MGEEIEVLIVEDDIRIADIHRRFTEKLRGLKSLEQQRLENKRKNG